MSNGTWSETARMRAFYSALAVSALGVGYVVWPFADVVLFAAVVAAVVGPIHERLVAALKGRRTLAALLTALGLALVVFIPLGLIAVAFVNEAATFVRELLRLLDSGDPDVPFLDGVAASVQPYLDQAGGWIGRPIDLQADVVDPLTDAAATGLQSVAGAVPDVLGSITNGVIDVIIFVFTVVTLLAEGPALMRFVLDLSPLDNDYERRLVHVFSEFATNLVVGSFVTAAAQGVVATFGYWVFGAPRALFFGILTAIGSFVPVVGTAIVIVPLSAYVAYEQGLPSAAGLLVYSVALTGSVDNLLRPMLMRGSSNLHPLLVFLTVFGGMYTMGLIGVLVGPVTIAIFLALAHIHRELSGLVAPAEAEAATPQPADPPPPAAAASQPADAPPEPTSDPAHPG